ncbi:3-ketoacyl-CoA thiolase [Chlamydiales bacterium SCGC AG-110-M15]|nr:3-ketoacyl-CoA thiolase [Chlamydiales bacterium SCGC AG-110-M15]
MKERIAIIEGIRTPFCKAGGSVAGVDADDLAAIAVKELLIRSNFPVEDIDEMIMGNVSQPVRAANVARVAALKAGLPVHTPAYSVQRNCASGMEAVSTAANKIHADQAEVIMAAAGESMTNIPFVYGPKMVNFFTKLSRSKTIGQKLKTLFSFRPSFLKPIIGLEMGLTDPISGMIMGTTAEVLSEEFSIGREEQDQFALNSHRKANEAISAGRLAEEIVPIPSAPKYDQILLNDDGPRADQTIEALQKLKPYFDRAAGSVTVGNACQITDGAGALLLMKESTAKERGLKPLGFVREHCYAGLECERMGLGPVYATSKLMDKTGLKVSDFNLIEINEAFAVQVIANERAFASQKFAQEYLNKDQALGEINPNILNVNGGAIALGHPVGATGIRIILTCLKELIRRKENLGLATLCIGGGQGAAFALEVE